MGIKYFFSWFRNRFSKRITQIKRKRGVVPENKIIIDNFLIDMNGIFHNCAQKVYEYGNHKPLKNLLGNKRNKQTLNSQLKFFQEVVNYIEILFDMVEPQKRLILCVDGVAPLSKQSQQRQRRFRASLDRKEEDFDSNCFTPGTAMMDFLTKYIDWFIRRKMSSDERWKNLEVIFSTEKTPSEGEHKLKNFIKRYGSNDETYMVQGMDADLIMLSLSTGKEHFYILREDHRSVNGDYFIIDVDNFKADLVSELIWEMDEKSEFFEPELAVYDFVLLCFMVGNDFLPNIPTIDILDGSLDIIISTYKDVGKNYGHIISMVDYKNKKIEICKKTLQAFIGTLSQYENQALNNKMTKGQMIEPDSLLVKYSTYSEEEKSYTVNFHKYKMYYYKRKLKDVEISDACHAYLKGIYWVIEYYLFDLPSWNWYYPYHYAPFLCDLAKNIINFPTPKWNKSQPIKPFEQLLCVLPIKSNKLIPEPIDKLVSLESELSEFYPTEFKIDLEGKKNDWEGVVVLPFVDLERVKKVYRELEGKINEKDQKRNVITKSYIYKECKPYLFKSFYGDIQNCSITTYSFEI